MIGYASSQMKPDDGAASPVTLLGRHLQDEAPVFTRDPLTKTPTDLVETGRRTLSHADLWVAAEAAEGRVKLCQEARRIGEQQHGLEESRRCRRQKSEGPRDLHLSRVVLPVPAGCSSSCSGSVLIPRCCCSAFLRGAGR